MDELELQNLVALASHTQVLVRGKGYQRHLKMVDEPHGYYHSQLLAEDEYVAQEADFALVEYLWNHRHDILLLIRNTNSASQASKNGS